MFFSALTLWAAGPWNRPIEHWTEDDAREILTDSPWAKAAIITAPGTVQRINKEVTVRWQSAAPIRLALRKQGRLPVGVLTDGSYVIAIANLSSIAGERELQDLQTKNLLNATLKPRGRKPIAALAVDVLLEDYNTPLLVFVFPEIQFVEEPVAKLPLGITPTPPQLEFSATIGSVVVKQKFPVRAMKYLGKLEL